jgi:two-component system, sensor histidine kinase and response regulator
MKNETSPHPHSILIVDDTPKNLQLMSSLLKQKGYKLYITNSGENALNFLKSTLPDLILLDVMMPGLSGFEVCRIIKNDPQIKDIPVIFLSAKNETDDVVEGFEAGAVDYIVKPFNAKEVFVRVATQLQLKTASKLLKEKNDKLKDLNNSLVESKQIIEEDARQLKKLNAEKNKFFSIIAHDLRGPFTGLTGLTQILCEQIDGLSPEEIREMVKMLHDSARQVYDLLNNLLQWSRLQMNSITFEPKSVNLKEAVQDAMLVLSNQTQSKEISVQIQIPDELSVFADINMLKTIIRNLVSNAVKFTRKGGEIKILAQPGQEDMTEISVIDNGIGMDPEMQKKLFLIDEKISRTGTDGETSNGIGLLICKDFVEKNSGNIRVESKPDKGTSFVFTLPSEKR